MTMYARVAGVWKQITASYAREGGIWKQADSVWVKRNGVWTQVSTSTHYEFYAIGQGQTTYPSANGGVWKNGVQTNAAQSSYNLYQFDQYGNMTSSAHYDLVSDVTNSVTTESDRFVADLNAMVDGQIFAVISFADSQAGHLSNGIDTAMYRVGALPGSFGQAMSQGGAYMLLNEVNAQFQTYETYVGSGTNATNASIYAGAYILNAKWVLG